MEYPLVYHKEKAWRGKYIETVIKEVVLAEIALVRCRSPSLHDACASWATLEALHAAPMFRTLISHTMHEMRCLCDLIEAVCEHRRSQWIGLGITRLNNPIKRMLPAAGRKVRRACTRTCDPQSYLVAAYGLIDFAIVCGMEQMKVAH